MAGLNLRNGGMQVLRERRWLGLCRLPAPGPEQYHLALHQMRKVLLDGAIDVGRGGCHRQSAGEGVEVAHLLLAFAGELGLLLHGVREMAGHDRDHHEQGEVNDLVRASDEEAVIGTEEEVPRHEHACDRGDQGGNKAEVPACEQDGKQIDCRSAPNLERERERINKDRRRRDHQQRDGAAAHLALEAGEASHGLPPYVVPIERMAER